MRIQRNELCPCGSGRKYKNCCISKSQEYIEILKLINSQKKIFDHKQEEVIDIIKKCEFLFARSQFTDEERQTIYMELIQLYKWAGYDRKVIDIVEKLGLADVDEIASVFIMMEYLHSLVNVGDLNKAFSIVEKIEPVVKRIEWGDVSANAIKSGAMLEIGKFYHYVNDVIKDSDFEINERLFLDYYDELIELYEKKYTDIDHYTGALANKGAYYLLSEQKEIQKKGLELLGKSYKEKLRVGNWNGVANDFSRMGVYFFKQKEYKQAIAFTKRDLQISKRYGSQRDVITSLFNLTKIYIEMYQLSDARYLLKMIEEIAAEIEFHEIDSIITFLREKIEDVAIQCKNNGITIGKKTLCACGSGKKYEECCGIADMDYSAIEKVLGIDAMIKYAEIEDYEGREEEYSTGLEIKKVLRKIEPNQIRLSWMHMIRDGAVDKLYELPDMSSIHLTSAKKLLEDYKEGDLLNEVSISISVVMLSMASLEAFLNQLVYLLSGLAEKNNFEERGFKIPEEVKQDNKSYQRNVGFSEKLNEIANIYTYGKWNRESFKRYDDLFKFIKVRNELVHFKSVDFFQIIPMGDNDILKSLPKCINFRDVTNSWPLRLLTDSFARWGMELVEETIDYIKDEYNKANSE